MMKDDDFKLFKGFALRRTNERTDGQTFAIVESLLRLKSVYFARHYKCWRIIVKSLSFVKETKNITPKDLI